MYDAPFMARRHGKAAAFEYFGHRHILGQHFGDELLEAAPLRKRSVAAYFAAFMDCSLRYQRVGCAEAKWSLTPLASIAAA